MVQILIYTNPLGKFDEETAKLVKLQIDNKFGIKILLYTNFPYEYNGVKAIVIPYIGCSFDKTSNKIPVILHIIDSLEDDLYWYHDFDCYQNSELNPTVSTFALSKYGYKDEWQCGSFFFRKSAKPIFELLNKEMNRRPRTRTDEKTLKKLVNKKLIIPEELNVSYNITYKYLKRTVPMADKPLKILHFHPTEENLKRFIPLMSEDLKRLWI